MSKILVVYYSFTGDMEYVAEKLKELTGAETERLCPQKEPPQKGIGRFIMGGMAAMFHSKVKIKALKHDLNDYDTIILASPVWAGTYPPATGTFLVKHKLEKKRICLIAGSKSGNGDKMLQEIEKKLTGNTIITTVNLKNAAELHEDTQKKLEEMCTLL